MTDSARDDAIATSPGHGKALEWLRRGPKRLCIAGERVDALSGRTFDTIDPATETVLAAVAEADAADAAAGCRRAPGLTGLIPS